MKLDLPLLVHQVEVVFWLLDVVLVEFTGLVVQSVLRDVRVEASDADDHLCLSKLLLFSFDRFHDFTPLLTVLGVPHQCPLLHWE